MLLPLETRINQTIANHADETITPKLIRELTREIIDTIEVRGG